MVGFSALRPGRIHVLDSIFSGEKENNRESEPVAQSVEQIPHKDLVGQGSSPPRLINIISSIVKIRDSPNIYLETRNK